MAEQGQQGEDCPGPALLPGPGLPRRWPQQTRGHRRPRSWGHFEGVDLQEAHYVVDLLRGIRKTTHLEDGGVLPT